MRKPICTTVSTMPSMNIRLMLLLAALLALAGCASSFSMQAETEVPTPLVTRLPLNMGVYYQDSFRNYTYEEDSEDRHNWSIASGKSQVGLFDTILPPMFSSVHQVQGITDPKAAGLDAVLVPEVAEMQFALPQETGSDVYEVWIKYLIHMYTPGGELIAEWPVTGYGKSSTEFLEGREKGLQSAINSAFRDAGAKFSINFTKVEDVKRWLSTKPGVCNGTGETICDNA